MDLSENIRRALQEVVLPEINVVSKENAEIKATLQGIHKRLDDVAAQQVDQSRRMDEMRVELNHRINETNKRIDELRADLLHRIDETNKRIDETNDRINRLYEVIVRREEHEKLATRMDRLEQDVADLKARAAA